MMIVQLTARQSVQIVPFIWLRKCSFKNVGKYLLTYFEELGGPGVSTLGGRAIVEVKQRSQRTVIR
jgi:hypothetical protein